MRYAFALVWLLNGLYAKIFGLVPRHRDIVARVVGETYADELTLAIGVAEVLFAVWIASGRRAHAAAVLQIVGVMSMNVIEFVLVPDLLLWGRLNILFALAYVWLVYMHTFRWNS